MIPIKGHQKYLIAANGDVWSTHRNRLLLLNQYEVRKYRRVVLDKKWQSVHRLVLSAYDREPTALEQCNHKDGNPRNNTLPNLEWVTASENRLHACQVLGKLSPICLSGKDNPRSIPVICVTTGKRYSGMAEAGRQTGIKSSSISKACAGTINKAGGLEWILA